MSVVFLSLFDTLYFLLLTHIVAPVNLDTFSGFSEFIVVFLKRSRMLFCVSCLNI